MNSSPPQIIDLDFTQFEIHPHYIISTVKEGVLVDAEKMNQINEVFSIYYKDKKFGYISNRINDFTVNPTCFLKASKVDNLVGMALLCYSEASVKTALFESSFYPRPSEVFFTKQSCISWIEEQLNIR